MLFSPKERLQMNLIADYGNPIEETMKQMEQDLLIGAEHLKPHKITGVYRAKMVDWMVEVLTAFKCDEQTLFLAVNLMDRYFAV